MTTTNSGGRILSPTVQRSQGDAKQEQVDGIHKFQRDAFRQEQNLVENLAEGQSRLALFITCSDSRSAPNLLNQTKPGELFIQRTVGSIVPPYGVILGGAAATIEYAVCGLKVKDIVVCGHSHCGAMGGLLNPQSVAKTLAVKVYLDHAEALRGIVQENYAQLTDPMKRLILTVEENIPVQLESLRTHPSVAAAAGRGDVTLHGWVYKFESGKVFAFNPDKAQLVALDDIDQPSA